MKGSIIVEPRFPKCSATIIFAEFLKSFNMLCTSMGNYFSLNFIYFSFRSGIGSFNNPYKNADEKKKLHTGTKGRRVKVLANHFPMRLQLESVFRYDVKFNLPWKRPVGKRDRPLLLRAIEEVKKNYSVLL